MSITSARATFMEAIGDKASVANATMHYLDGGRTQVFRFAIVDQGGTGSIVEIQVPYLADVATTIKAAAELHAKGM